MHLDKQALEDLSIFTQEEEYSIFHKINFTTTDGGRNYLRYFLSNPLDDLSSILNTQETLRCIGSKSEQWPKQISNGTIIMIERFFESDLNEIPYGKNFIQNWFHKTFFNADFGIIKFSVTHFIDFIN